jgi:HSP20 family protein
MCLLNICTTNYFGGYMNLIKYEPFGTMVRRMENFWNAFDNRPAYSHFSQGYVPKVDISEDGGNFFIQVEVPGFPKDHVKVTINDENLLTIRGEMKHEEKNEDKNYLRIERRAGSFERSFSLPDNVDRENIEAKFENGLLNVTIKKKEPEQPKVKEISLS